MKRQSSRPRKDQRGRKADVQKSRRNLWASVIQPNLDLIEGWARRGYTEESMAETLGISYVTWWTAKKEHPSLIHALNKGWKDACVLVENSLFREATGYEEESVKRTIVGYDDAGEPIVTETVVTTKWHRPSPTAMMFWLLNKAPTEWSNVTAVNRTDGNGRTRTIELSPNGTDVRKLDDKELDALAGLIEKATGGDTDDLDDVSELALPEKTNASTGE